MKSRITVEIDFENGNEPIMQVHYRQSDDVRDKLIKNFFENVNKDRPILAVDKVFYPSEPDYNSEMIFTITTSPKWIRDLKI